MAEIVPFRGILYNVSRVSADDVLAPPYDIITPEYQEKLYSKSPYNIVRIDFGKEEPETTRQRINTQGRGDTSRNGQRRGYSSGVKDHLFMPMKCLTA